MNRILKGLAALISRSHVGVLAVTGVLTVGAVLMLSRLEIKPDIMDVLPAKNPAIETFTNFIEDFGTTDNLIVVFESKGKKAEDYFDAAAALSERLLATGLVDFVDYNALGEDFSTMAARFPLYLDKAGFGQLKERLSAEGVARQVSRNKSRLLSPFSSPADTELIMADPLNIRGIVSASIARAASGRGAGAHGFYVSKDNSLLLVFVKPAGESRDLGFLMRFRGALKKAVDGTVKGAADPSDLRVSYAGPYAFAMEADARLVPEVMTNALVSALLVLFLFKFVFRKKLLVAGLAGFTLFVALAWTLASARLIFGSLNMVSSVVTAMLMGLGIDYIIHIFTRCEDECRDGAGIDSALMTAFTKTAPGIATGALTTTAAFFCIVTTSFEGMHSLGIIAGIGVLACLASTLLVMSSVMVLFERRWKGVFFSPKKRTFALGGAAGFIDRRPGAAIAISVLALLVAAAGLAGLRFDNTPESIGLRDSEAARAEASVAESFGRRRNPLVITASAENPKALMERYSRLDAVVKGWTEHGVIQGASTAGVFLPPLERQREVIEAMAGLRAGFSETALRRAFKSAMLDNGFVYQSSYDDYLKRVAAATTIDAPIGFEAFDNTSGKRLRLFYNKDKMKTAAYIFPKDALWDTASLASVQSGVAALGDGFELTGAVMMFANLKSTIIRESVIASLIAFVLIAFILYAQFRSLRDSCLVVVPLTTGLLLTLGFMGIVGLNLNFINVAAIPLLLGIGVDYGVYIVQDRIEARSLAGAGAPPVSSVARVGAVVVMCALTTMAGFGSLATIAFKGIASLGIMIAIGVAACLFAAIFLLPAVMRHLDKRSGSA